MTERILKLLYIYMCKHTPLFETSLRNDWTFGSKCVCSTLRMSASIILPMCQIISMCYFFSTSTKCGQHIRHTTRNPLCGRPSKLLLDIQNEREFDTIFIWSCILCYFLSLSESKKEIKSDDWGSLFYVKLNQFCSWRSGSNWKIRECLV